MKLYTTLLLTIAIVASTYAQPLCRIQRYDENDGLTQWHITQMTQDRQGMMWFSTWNGICRYDGYEFKGFKGHVGDGSKISTDRFRNIWLNNDGNIGCRIDDDIFLFNLKTYRFENAPHVKQNQRHAKSIKPNQPYSYHDKQGVTWTVRHDGKLTYKIPHEKETPYTEQSLPEQARLCFPDIQGNLWVAGTSGLYKICFPKRNGTIIQNKQNSEAKTFFKDNHNRYWIAMKGDNTVSIFDSSNKLVGNLSKNGTITQTANSFGCPIYCITQTHDGTIWMGSKPGGLYRLKESNTGTSYSIEKIKNTPCDNIYDIKEDRWGRLWVATLGGGVFCIVNPQSAVLKILSPWKDLKSYPHKLAQKARMIYITKNDVMLAATTNGLLVAKLLPGESIKNMQFHCHTREPNRKNALSCSATMNIAEDYKGRIFVSTESGGINMINDKDLTLPSLSFKHYDKASGLPTDIALSVVPYGRSLLIVSSNRLVILNPDNNASATFGKKQFLSECRFSEATPLKLQDGNWIFGLQDGTFRANMGDMRKNCFTPKIALTNISIQGTDRDIPINALDTLTLTSDERSLTLDFAALDYSPDANIKYVFSLSKGENNGETKWNDVGGNHSVTLLDLAPATYTLLIKSTNADGTWVDNVRSLTIVVTPRFTETTTAFILLIALIAAFLWGIGYTVIYIRKIRKQRHEALEAYLELLNSMKGDSKETSPVLTKKLSEEDDKLMRQVSAFVNDHLSDADANVSAMAEAAAVSRSGLQRKMKQIMGVTPIEFLKEARIKHACHLLSSTTQPISEIAFSCGFTDPKYFSRSFKASTGKTPKEWREQTKLP